MIKSLTLSGVKGYLNVSLNFLKITMAIYESRKPCFLGNGGYEPNYWHKRQRGYYIQP